MKFRFEWDPEKAKINLKKHGLVLKKQVQYLKIHNSSVFWMKNILWKKNAISQLDYPSRADS